MVAVQRSVDSINDPETNKLLAELEEISGISRAEFHGRMLLHFLQTAMSPNGAAYKPTPISKQDLDSCDVMDSFILRRKVGKTGNDLHSVCASLAQMKGKHVDDYHGTSLYVFLGKMIINRSPRQNNQRWFRR